MCHLDDLSRFERVASEDDAIVLCHQVLNHVHLRRNLRVALVMDTRTRRRALLFSTGTDMDVQALYRSYKALFTSMSALTLSKLEARQQSDANSAGFSRASVKRRAFNQHPPELFSQHLAQGHSLEKSNPEYQSFCNDGTITERAA